MRKNNGRKLVLGRETMKTLGAGDLGRAAGGSLQASDACLSNFCASVGCQTIGCQQSLMCHYGSLSGYGF